MDAHTNRGFSALRDWNAENALYRKDAERSALAAAIEAALRYGMSANPDCYAPFVFDPRAEAERIAQDVQRRDAR